MTLMRLSQLQHDIIIIDIIAHQLGEHLSDMGASLLKRRKIFTWLN